VTEVKNDAVNSVVSLQRRPLVEITGVSQTKSNQCIVERGVGTSAVTSAQRIPVSNAHALRTGYVETARLEALLKASPSNFLGIVRHDRSPREPSGLAACPVVCLDMPQLNGPPLAEVWTSALSVTYHQAEGIHCAMNGEVLFGALQLEESPGTLLDTVTYTAYRRLLVQARALGYPHLLRVWNYFPHINRKSDGLERYQRFCAGRHQALAEGLSDFPRTLPAGTAVGTMSGPLKIHFLAARQPGTHVENPRQVSAYEYPRVYGPRSPSFARATLRPSISGSHLLIAGTASVVGHVSEHIGEPHKQTLEIIHNLNALIIHTEQLHGITRGQWYGQALFKIYIRHREHFATIRDILKEQLPSHTQVLYLQGEMCRSELLLEVEGVLGQEKTIDVSQTVSPTRARLQQPAIFQHAQPDSFKIV
jgi:chorismate lyase / 3-hydroxybenzoate synthase